MTEFLLSIHPGQTLANHGQRVAHDTARSKILAFNLAMLEAITEWCRDSGEFAEARHLARISFFGDADLRPVKYFPGAGEPGPRARRFLGHFMVTFQVASGQTPAEVAVTRLYDGTVQAEAAAAVSASRFVVGVVGNVSGREISLKAGCESFRIRHSSWAGTVRRNDAVAVWLVPSRHGMWLLGPGRVTLPVTFSPAGSSNFRDKQVDPILVERLLQGREILPQQLAEIEHPTDPSLAPPEIETHVSESEETRGAVSAKSKWKSLIGRLGSSRSIHSLKTM